jgi:hypothetical protein
VCVCVRVCTFCFSAFFAANDDDLSTLVVSLLFVSQCAVFCILDQAVMVPITPLNKSPVYDIGKPHSNSWRICHISVLQWMICSQFVTTLHAQSISSDIITVMLTSE